MQRHVLYLCFINKQFIVSGLLFFGYFIVFAIADFTFRFRIFIYITHRQKLHRKWDVKECDATVAEQRTKSRYPENIGKGQKKYAVK